MGILKVNLRGGFSDRHDIKKINTTIQLDKLDERTRIAIVNRINSLYSNYFGKDIIITDYRGREFWHDILSNVYLQVVDFNSVYNSSALLNIIKSTILEDEYDDVLTLVEYFINELIKLYPYREADIVDAINSTFEKEYVGYRFIESTFVPITDNVEVQEIEEVLSMGVDNVSNHITKALQFLSDREKPDYKNSIKESITAVEAMCDILIGKKDPLGKALEKLERKGINIHKSLKEAFIKLYGYTSDSSGIRHAGELDGPNATFEEAKYMVVVCSAFINYLKGQMAKV